VWLEGDHYEYLGIHGRIILKGTVHKQYMKVWSEFNCLRIGTSAGSNGTWQWTFRCHDIPGVLRVVEQLLASYEGVQSMKLVN
jgi:hypothetical protein